MNDKKRNKELLHRRDFFKKATKTVVVSLPMIIGETRIMETMILKMETLVEVQGIMVLETILVTLVMCLFLVRMGQLMDMAMLI